MEKYYLEQERLFKPARPSPVQRAESGEVQDSDQTDTLSSETLPTPEHLYSLVGLVLVVYLTIAVAAQLLLAASGGS
jgi:hypothetical protein